MTNTEEKRNVLMPVQQIDWIKQMYYSDSAEALIDDIYKSFKATDAAFKAAEETWEKYIDHNNDDEIDIQLNEYLACNQMIGFKAGYIAAMNIARECYCK